MRAVQFDQFGGPEVLEVRDVPDPVADSGHVVVRVVAAGIQPGEIPIREGRFEGDLPSGEGTDFAGVVETAGDGVTGIEAGDEVIGWSEERSSHAELVAVPADQIVAKPASLSWAVAGSLFVVSMAAWGSIEAVKPRPGDTVVVSAAAGGVGGFAAQLAVHAGATTIGLAGEAHHDWLRGRGIVPVTYGDGQEERIRAAAPGGVDAFIDTFGGGYVDLAVELGVAPARINTIIDFEAAGRVGASRQGTHQTATPERLAEAAALVAAGTVELPIAATYTLDQVREAYSVLAERHTRGKIVLLPQ
jgi:NADPH:quinone reductase-like Zn-dependent oxidoreductase